MIRKAVPDDRDGIYLLAIEALEIDPYEELLISKERVRSLVVELISSPASFMWVSENDGKVTGVLAAFVSPMLFYERNTAQIVMWYDKGGDGMRLMSQFIKWADSRKAIKEVQYCGERGGDKRILKYLIKRYGFADNVPLLHRLR